MNDAGKILLKIKRFIEALKIVLLFVPVTLLCVACNLHGLERATQTEQEAALPTPSTAPTLTQPPIAILTPTAQTQTPPTIADEYAPYGVEMFAPIINAYAALEQSDYNSFDEDIIGDSLLAESNGISYKTAWSKPTTLMYAFYDINGDGLMELFIGADKSITGIYVLQSGNPVSVLQVEDRHGLGLLRDSGGKCVIEDSWGHMGSATEFFYTIAENGKLVTLDKLYTLGDNISDGEWIGHFRAKDVGGEEVDITEEEYCELIRKYGSSGYELLEDIEEARMIRVAWEPVATYNEHILNSENTLLNRANLVLHYLKYKDLEQLAAIVHPTKGVTFTPYAYVSDMDLNFPATELIKLSGEQRYIWGEFDGSGHPMELSFSEYDRRFIYSADFINAEMIGNNKIIYTGLSINNIEDAYPNAKFVEYHFSGFDKKLDGSDWQSLRLVFEEVNNELYLVGIVHDSWQI